MGNLSLPLSLKMNIPSISGERYRATSVVRSAEYWCPVLENVVQEQLPYSSPEASGSIMMACAVVTKPADLVAKDTVKTGAILSKMTSRKDYAVQLIAIYRMDSIFIHYLRWKVIL